MMQYEVVKASFEDSSACLQLLKNTALWMNTKGTFLWNPAWFTNDFLIKSLGNEEVVCIKSGQNVIGMMLIQENDPVIWPHLGKVEDTFFIHKLCISRNSQYRGLSGIMLDWAIAQGRQANKKYLRLDCARRRKLVEIYKNKGFIEVSKFNMRREGLPMYYGVRMELAL